jgi:hypothetical protein
MTEPSRKRTEGSLVCIPTTHHSVVSGICDSNTHRGTGSDLQINRLDHATRAIDVVDIEVAQEHHLGARSQAQHPRRDARAVQVLQRRLVHPRIGGGEDDILAGQLCVCVCVCVCVAPNRLTREHTTAAPTVTGLTTAPR